jgi:hypothetical protein
MAAVVWFHGEELLLAAFGASIVSFHAPLLPDDDDTAVALDVGAAPRGGGGGGGVERLTKYRGHAFKVDAMAANFVAWTLVSVSRSEAVKHDLLTGAQLWHYDACARVTARQPLAERVGVTALAVCGRNVYVGCDDGSVHALSLDTGALRTDAPDESRLLQPRQQQQQEHLHPVTTFRNPVRHLSVDERGGAATFVVMTEKVNPAFGGLTNCATWTAASRSASRKDRQAGPAGAPASNAFSVEVMEPVSALLVLPSSSTRNPHVAAAAVLATCAPTSVMTCIGVPSGNPN